MAFGQPSYYPYNYQNNYQMPVYQQPTVAQPTAQQSNGIIWVQGEAGAKAYPVAPGSNVLLMDSENRTMYLKGADASGMPSMRIFDYTERTAQTQAQNDPKREYVTREEFGKLVGVVTVLKESLEGKNE